MASERIERLMERYTISGSYGTIYGNGYGYGSSEGTGNGYGYGYTEESTLDLKSINGMPIAKINGTSIAFESIRGNVAKGFILKEDLSLRPCFVVKEGGKFAHGNTLQEAYSMLQEKMNNRETFEERLEKFMKN